MLRYGEPRKKQENLDLTEEAKTNAQSKRPVVKPSKHKKPKRNAI